jgi:hypothetical protein
MISIFRRLDAFEEYPVLKHQHFADPTGYVALRHVNIIKDLSLLYRWLNDPLLITNSRLMEKNNRLIRHYRRSLESETGQSFLVEEKMEVLCQFDISLIILHELYLRMPTSTGDCILTYLLTGSALRFVHFKNALRIQLDYFFSASESQRIWVNIPVNQPLMRELFVNAGFSLKSEYTARQQQYVILYLRKTQYLIS